jgi:hypothetical protein
MDRHDGRSARRSAGDRALRGFEQRLEVAGGTGLDPDKDGHVHQGEIRFLSADRIEHRWFHYVGPKELGSTHWFLQRQMETPAEPVAAPEPPTEPAT